MCFYIIFIDIYGIICFILCCFVNILVGDVIIVYCIVFNIRVLIGVVNIIMCIVIC